MKRFDEKLGSNAVPSRPRSPEVLRPLRVRNGVLSRAPFLITRSRPACSETNTRPSGAMESTVGLLRPLATVVSLKPLGRVAAAAAVDMRAAHRAALHTGRGDLGIGHSLKAG